VTIEKSNYIVTPKRELNRIFASMKIRFNILFLVLFLSLKSSAQSPEERVSQLLDSAEYYMYTQNRTDSALFFALQTEVFKDALKGKYERLERIELLLYKAFGKSNNKKRELVHLKELNKIQNEKHNNQPSPVMLRNLGRFGTYFLEVGDYDQSKHYFQEAIQLANQFGVKVKISATSNNLGFLYEKMGEKDKAFDLYQRAIDTLESDLKSNIDSSLLVSIKENIARLLISQKEYRKAEEILINNYSYLKRRGTNRNVRITRAAFYLIDIYDKLGEAHKMRPYLEAIPNFLVDPDYEWVINHKIRLQNAWIRYYQLLGEYELALEKQTASSLLVKALIGELSNRNAIVNTAISDAKVQEVKDELETQQLRLEKTELDLQNRYNLLIFTIILSIIGIITVYFYQKRKVTLSILKQQLEKKELENQQLRNEQLSQDLKHKEADFSNFVMQSTLKENLVLDIVEKLNQFVKDKSVLTINDLKQLIRELKPQKEVSKKMELYQDGVAMVNNSFLDKLIQDYPSLTKTEKEVCCLMRLNLTGKEIASMRNIDPASVKKMRNRIRKKLNVTPDINLYEFIQQL
jgi:tetratricopeptide (TPR) repeat protein